MKIRKNVTELIGRTPLMELGNYAGQAGIEGVRLLAKLEISLRLLAGRLGISQDGLSRKAAMTLKAALVQEDVSAWKSDLLTVLHELEET